MTPSKQGTWWRSLAMLLSLVVVAAACGGRGDDDAGDAGGTSSTTEAPDGDEGDGDEEEEPAGDPTPTAGFDGTTIKVGALTPTSGRVSVIGGPLTAGNKAYFDQLNAAGGVAGRYPVELVVRDSRYEVPAAAQEYAATKDDVVMYAQVLGTAVVSALLPDLDADGIVAAPASLDSFWVREQHLLPIGGPYQVQAINGVDWYVKEGDGEGKKICSLTQDDPYGEAGQQGLDFAADELGIDLGPQVRFTAGATDYTTQVNQLQGEGCEAVLFVATPADAAAALGKAAQVGYAPTWLAQSPVWLKLLFQGDLRPYAEANVVLLTEGPAWGDTSVKGMVDIMEALATYGGGQQPDLYFTFGYTQARAVHQVLEAAVAAGDLSHEGIVEALDGIELFEFDGLVGDYRWGPPEDRDPPRATTIAKVDIAGSPLGYTPLVTGYTSEAAEAFEFEG